MKISLEWLKDYVEIDEALSPEKIADIFSNLGFPCEAIETLADDTVLDLEVTSNRGDCLSYIGMAREFAAVTGAKLKTPDIKLDESQTNVAELAQVAIENADLCWRYTAGVIEGIKVGPSPDWMRKRLEAIGQRSVNNVVDATNYAMMETGQPSHAFDYAKIAEGRIIVRSALPGERLVSIDGSKCDLDPDMLIIADPDGPIAIAGVMGGLDTEVSDSTETVLLEVAYFDPVSVRSTSRKLALPSEASFRFERIVDVQMADNVSQRTAQLIIQAAGGKAAKGIVDIYPKKPKAGKVTLRLSRLNSLLGIEIPPDEVLKILSRLSFCPRLNDDSIFCSVPSWRSDVYREADLIEEVARVYGYSKIPTERKIQIEVAPVDLQQKLIESTGAYLNGCGFYETISVAFVDNAVSELFVRPHQGRHLGVKDVSRKNANLLRQTLLPSLLEVLKTNLNAQNTPCRIFEIADTFAPAGRAGELPLEKTKLALVCDSDLRDLRGTVEGLAVKLGKNAQVFFEPADLVWARVGAQILVNGQSIGTAGIVNTTVTDKFDFDNLTPCAAELDFGLLMALQAAELQVRPIPRFPAIERDLSIILDEKVPWSDIEQGVRKKAPAELEDVKFVGVYHGKTIPAGKKSVTFSTRFRDEDGTLTHEAVDAFQADIVNSLSKCVNAELRTV